MSDTTNTTSLVLSNSTTIPLGYYRCLEATKYIEAGLYVRVVRVEPSGANGPTVEYQRRNRGYTHDLDDFLRHFTFAPEGAQVFQQDLLALTSEMNAIAQEVVALEASLANTGGTLDPQNLLPADVDTGTAIVPMTDRSPRGYKQMLARASTLATHKREQLGLMQEELKAMLAEQMAVADALIKPLTTMVRRLQDTIWTINLYLGRDEEIVQLRDGAPAPGATPITVRQLVLAMDQECAVAAEEGGIDALDIAKFDAWLVARPEHLEQILPEPKGVVVLVPRWDAKRYDDPWLSRAVAEANQQSYFLIRNGERVYRMATDFIVGRTLLPTQAEFLELFFDRVYDPTTGEYTRVQLEPGTRAYMEAEEKADARRRHYMRIALILQGLIDRTTLFHPLPGVVQVTSVESYERGWIQLINDGELILSDGHESFEAWQARINAELEPGMRIIGNFSRWDGSHRYSSFGSYHRDSESRYSRSGNSRLSPSSADYPESLALHQLEGKRDDGLFFYFDRGEVWTRDEGFHQSERRASCVVKHTDRFILAYDAATLDELVYYLHSRTNRHDYVMMLPLLKAAIRMKRAEAAQEAPFRQLLVAQIMLRYGVDADVAEAEIPTLVEWYKFKTKNHRPLVGDNDAKALRMIVDEFAIRLRERQNRAARETKGEFAKIQEVVLNEHPNALLIAHKSGTHYVALVPSNDDQVFVTEITRTLQRVVEIKEWRIVDNRFQRWQIIYTSERWTTWRINASLSENLTDPEIHELGPLAQLQAIRSHQVAQQQYARSDGQDQFVVLATTFDRDTNSFHVYAFRRDAQIPALLLTESARSVNVSCHTFPWHRTVTREALLDKPTSESVEWPETGRPWEANQYRRSSRSGRTLRRRAEVVMFENHDALALVQTEKARYTVGQQQRKHLQRLVGQAKQTLAQQWEERENRKRFQAFLDEYDDLTLWEGHKKTLKRLQFPYGNEYLDQLLNHLIERNIDLQGMTVAEAMQRFHDILGEEEPGRWRHAQRELQQLQLDDFVLVSAEGTADDQSAA